MLTNVMAFKRIQPADTLEIPESNIRFIFFSFKSGPIADQSARYFSQQNQPI